MTFCNLEKLPVNIRVGRNPRLQKLNLSMSRPSLIHLSISDDAGKEAVENAHCAHWQEDHYFSSITFRPDKVSSLKTAATLANM